MKMLEMKLTITAPELSEAINNLAKAITSLAPTTPNGTTACAAPTNTTCVPVEQPTPNPITPATAPQTAQVVQSTPPVSYPTEATQSAQSTPPAQPTTQPTTQPTVPTAAPQYTCEMISKAGATLIEAGKMNELLELLARFGVEAVTSLDPAQYGAFATELRAMGASI